MPDYNFDKYSDEELQNQINRLRSELNALKQVVEDRAAENSSIKREVSKTQELLAVIHRSVDKIAVKLDDVDASVSMTAHDVNDVVEEEIQNLSELIDNKSKQFELSIKQIDNSVEFQELSKKLDAINEHLESRLGQAGIRAFKKRLERLSVLSIANAIGTFLTVGLLVILVLAIL